MRTALVHVGTHKTGTKALQVFCATNRDVLQAAGICYPRAGRVDLGPGSSTPGHHQIAFDLMRTGESPALDAALAEIDAADAPSVVLSSEELHMLDDGGLDRIVRSLRSRHYRTVAVLYLRPQAYYAESLYAEFVKGGRVTDFRTYFDEILRTGEFQSTDSRSTIFEYSRLIARVAGVFSNADLVVRPYHSDRKPEALFSDFLNVIAHVRGVPISSGFRNPMPRANASLTLYALLERVCSIGGAETDAESFVKERFPDVPRAVLDARFSLLMPGDVAGFIDRFNADNRQVNATCGLALPTANDVPDAGDPRFENAKTHRAILAALLEH